MIAIMQPYLFPYLGYFQLITASDTFVLFDDVNYIKKGYINRNNILLNGSAYRFTVPVQNIS
ncbi:WbqC family protein, partial [Escherichia coli]|nr:WbqC family protein [Escherichia coli]